MSRAAAVLAMLLLISAPALAQDAPRVPLRAGSHADHGRLVFDWPARVGYRIEEQDGQVAVRFDAPATIDLAAARRPPRNVLGVEQADGAVVVRVAPGARLRHFRLGNRIVLDLLDGGEAPAPVAQRANAAEQPLPLPPPLPTGHADPPGAPASAPRPAPARLAGGAAAAREPDAGPARAVNAAPARRTDPPPGSTGTPAPDRPATPAHDASPTPARPGIPAPARDTTSAPTRQANAAPARETTVHHHPAPTTHAPSPADAAAAPTAVLAARDAVPVRLLPGAPAIAIPADAEAGLALFRRGETVFAIIDRPMRLDLAALARHPVFGSAVTTLAGEATVLRLRLAPPAVLQARRDGAAWVLEARPEAAAADPPPLRVVPEPGPPARLALQGGLAAEALGTVVALPDPETGEPLLVGTLRRPGPGIAVARRLPEVEILPSMMGAAILPRADRVVLRVAGEGFRLEASTGALALGAAPGRDPPADSVAMSRLLDLPVAEVPALMERLRTQLLTLHETPPLARGAPRRAAAETLLALGLPQEAQAMVGLGLREDARAQDDPRMLLAQGVSALLSGRLDEARVLGDRRLPPSDELTLWRALLVAARGEVQAAAPALAAGAPLVLAYPDALRARILPPLIETLASGGEAPRAARLLAEAGEAPGLELARAMLAEAEGRTEDALRLYAEVAASRDRRQRAAALRRATELRLSSGAIDAAGAADALDQALFAWRGGAQELDLRRRIAALRLASGNGPAAFAMLDEAGRVFPDQARVLRPDLAEAFAVALETAPPLAATTLFDAHPDLLPEGERGEAAVLLLAERLAALDLAGRAAELLDRAAARAAPPARAAIGARLAALRMAEGDAAAALAALDRSAADDVPAPLATQRTRLRARALARRGDRAGAEQALATLGPAGAEARADLRAEAQDWAGAAAAQREHLAALLPAAPAPLGQPERAALARAAAFAALAGEDDALVALREAHGARMAGGPLAEAFDLLTADPLRGLADLPRLQRELGLLRVLPTRLEALRAGVQVAR
jgi:hypothetical protein